MFLAYDAVHFTLYPAYELYALLELGTPEAAHQARYLMTNKDEQAVEFNNALRLISWEGRGVYQEDWRVNVVRSSNGVTFDLYFVDEDSLFLASAVEVPAGQVLAKGTDLMANWRKYDHVSFHPSEGDTRFTNVW